MNCIRKTNHHFFIRLTLLNLVLTFTWIITFGQHRSLISSPVSIKVIDSPGYFIPTNFTGLSFESDAAMPNHRGVNGYFFSSENKQLITLFRNSGIRILRVGGGNVDIHPEAAHNQAAIDSVFSFAKAAGIKVIYSLPLLNANDSADAVTAKYIWDTIEHISNVFPLAMSPTARLIKRRRLAP